MRLCCRQVLQLTGDNIQRWFVFQFEIKVQVKRTKSSKRENKAENECTGKVLLRSYVATIASIVHIHETSKDSVRREPDRIEKR